MNNQPTPNVLLWNVLDPESIAEAEPILASVMPYFWSRWSGDETAIGIVVKATRSWLLFWFDRDLARQRLAERRAPACEAAITALDAPPVPGMVTLLVAGRERVLVVPMKSSAVRAAGRLTSFRAGVA